MDIAVWIYLIAHENAALTVLYGWRKLWAAACQL